MNEWTGPTGPDERAGRPIGADARLVALQAKHPEYEIWIVHRLYQSALWCARPKGAPAATHHAYSDAELDEDLTEAEAGERLPEPTFPSPYSA